MAEDNSFHNPFAVVLEEAELPELALRFERGGDIADVSEALTPEERFLVYSALNLSMVDTYEPRLHSHLTYLQKLCEVDSTKAAQESVEKPSGVGEGEV